MPPTRARPVAAAALSLALIGPASANAQDAYVEYPDAVTLGGTMGPWGGAGGYMQGLHAGFPVAGNYRLRPRIGWLTAPAKYGSGFVRADFVGGSGYIDGLFRAYGGGGPGLAYHRGGGGRFFFGGFWGFAFRVAPGIEWNLEVGGQSPTHASGGGAGGSVTAGMTFALN